ncbi:MAG: SHOCT domain-containing protein [Gammaproteobacteria bacterium]|nr:SHOCT domain-containing protein [Gammaproteobacteria bacterium]
MHTFGDWWFFGMHALWWLFWAAILIAVFMLLRPTSAPQSRGTPLERLQHRYANGEISTEEYEERKNTLERDAAERR